METGKAAAVNFLYRNEIKSGKVLVDGAYVSAAAGLGACLPLWITSVWALVRPGWEEGGKGGSKDEGKDEGKGIHPGCRIFFGGLIPGMEAGA